MPDGYVCYAPPDDSPEVGPLPALAARGMESHFVRGRWPIGVTDQGLLKMGPPGEGRAEMDSAGLVTFGSFNNPSKIAPQVVACWAEILRRLPRSRLILKYARLDDPGTQDRLRRLFAERGIAAHRVEFSGYSPQREFLAWYNRVDLALDTFPYNGGLTTIEALWMGVPVVTLPGETFAGRHSLSHLSNVGLTETIAGSLDEYVELAVRLAEDLPRLAALRAGLRRRVAQSPLCDGKRFADNLLEILRRIWREWQDAQPRMLPYR
jgi:predicted O-linked N-acetylglucosamine transferase (SPINDLY family)